MKALWRRLEAAGVLGMNRRNAAYLAPHNSPAMRRRSAAPISRL